MITLRWINPNPPGVHIDQVNVYRSTQPISPEALPGPIATLSGSATSFADEDAVDGVPYYYRVSLDSGGQSLVSGEQQITGPDGAAPPIDPPAVSALAAYLYDDTGRLLYSKEGDKVRDNWASTRKILAAIVVWEEKKDVWDTELVTITTEDINSTGPEFRSGAQDGDQITWKGVVELLLVPSMSDVANVITRVLGQELKDKYGIGETAERAIGYWMSTAAIRAGARNTITLTATSDRSAPADEMLSTNMLTSAHALSRCLQYTLRYPELRRIMQMQEVSVPVVGGGTLDHPSIDRLRLAADSSGELTGYELDGYVAGKTGDSSWGNQVFACGMPSGDTIYGTVYQSTTRELRYRDLLRVIQAAENQFPHLRGAESAPDPHANNVSFRLLGSALPEDSSPESRDLTVSGVSSTETDYMTGTALRFEGAGYIVADGTPPTFGADDFTVEVFLRGGASLGDSTQNVVGVWYTVSGGRSWAIRISTNNIEFLYSTDGENNTVVTFPAPSSYVLNQAPSHICVQRSGDELAIFLNGQRSPLFDVSGISFHAPTVTDLVVGARRNSGGSGYHQNLTADVDEVIITPGVARYSMSGFRSRYRPGRWG